MLLEFEIVDSQFDELKRRHTESLFMRLPKARDAYEHKKIEKTNRDGAVFSIAIKIIV